MSQLRQLDLTHAQLLVLDLQQRMLPHIADHGRVVENTIKMLQAARVLDVHVTISEQYPKGLGPSEPRVLEAAGVKPKISKTAFSVCADEDARMLLSSHMRPQVIIVGVETHICVQQTALDLLDMQMKPFVLADAVGSRRGYDHSVALDRMRAAGVSVTTVESAIYELMKRAGTDQFKRMLPIVR